MHSSTSRCDAERRLDEIAQRIATCRKCPLWESRTNTVPGEGDPCRGVVFIGEAPGRNEDLKGRPFVGVAGRLLTEMLEKRGLSRAEVFITNIVKCRPPGNRDPRPNEIAACMPYLDEQLSAIKPRLVVMLGRHSARHVLERYLNKKPGPIMSIRGRVYRGKAPWGEAVFFPTLHPAAALYNPKLRDLLEKDFDEIARLIREVSGGARRGYTLDDFL